MEQNLCLSRSLKLVICLQFADTYFKSNTDGLVVINKKYHDFFNFESHCS